MRRLIVTSMLALALVAPTAAHASGAAVIRDCTDDGRLEGHYTQRELREALASLPSDVDEYTDCRDVIRRAAFAAGGSSKGGGTGTGGGGSSGGEFGGFGNTPTPAGQDPLSSASAQERKAVAAAQKQGGDAVRFSDGALVRPGAVARRSADVADVPGPLVAVVLLLAAAALTAAIPSFRTRVLARRRP